MTLTCGFPIGVVMGGLWGIVHLHPSGVLPAVDKDQYTNYKSFHEAQLEAEGDLDRVSRGKFAPEIASLEDLAGLLQDDPHDIS